MYTIHTLAEKYALSIFANKPISSAAFGPGGGFIDLMSEISELDKTSLAY